MLKRGSLILAVVLVAVTAFAAACGDDDGGGAKAAEVEAAIQAANDAWNAGDLEGFLAAFTDDGIRAIFDGATRDEAQQFLSEEVGQPPFGLGEFSNTQVDGDTATTEVDTFTGGLGTSARISLVREADQWLIDGEEFITGDVPEGATAVDLALTEYAFNFDAEEITSGNFAFNVENIGGEPHEIGMARISEDADLEELVRSEEDEPPDLLEDIGFVGPFEPDSQTTVLLTEELGPGRYAMACFVEAADGEPHALKGMIAEFTIE